MKSESKEVNEVTWTCTECGHENKDLLQETNEPLCGGCDKNFHWNDLEIDVTTIIGEDETYVNLGEICLIEERLINEVDELSKENVVSKPFSTKIPVGWVPAYWGTFGEFVPFKFE